jgi:hypothetical protein
VTGRPRTSHARSATRRCDCDVRCSRSGDLRPVRETARGPWLTSRRDDARWAREYLAPWVNRRLHGVSSGDGRTAKRPQLSPVSPPILM